MEELLCPPCSPLGAPPVCVDCWSAAWALGPPSAEGWVGLRGVAYGKSVAQRLEQSDRSEGGCFVSSRDHPAGLVSCHFAPRPGTSRTQSVGGDASWEGPAVSWVVCHHLPPSLHGVTAALLFGSRGLFHLGTVVPVLAPPRVSPVPCGSWGGVVWSACPTLARVPNGKPPLPPNTAPAL